MRYEINYVLEVILGRRCGVVYDCSHLLRERHGWVDWHRRGPETCGWIAIVEPSGLTYVDLEANPVTRLRRVPCYRDDGNKVDEHLEEQRVVVRGPEAFIRLASVQRVGR